MTINQIRIQIQILLIMIRCSSNDVPMEAVITSFSTSAHLMFEVEINTDAALKMSLFFDLTEHVKLIKTTLSTLLKEWL